MLYSRFIEYNYLTRLKLHFPLSPGTDHTILLISLCLTILDASYQLISERNQSQKSKHFPVFENDLVAYFAMSTETAFCCSVFFGCCCCSVFKSCPHLCTPVTAACHAALSFVISLSLLKFMCTESVMSSNHLILCCPLLLLPSIFPSIRVFSSEFTLCIRWPKCWSLSISPSMNIQGWFPLGWTSVNSLLYKGLSSVFSSTTVGKHQLCDI